MADSILIDIQDHVAIVTLNRPEKLNAADQSVFSGMIDAGDALAERDDVRAIVLQGAGRCFCSGIDVTSLMSDGTFMQKAFETGEKSPANFAQRAAYVWQEVPQPVVAAVHGECFGAGLQFAMAADIRVGAPDVDMRVLEIKWGIVPDMSLTQTALHTVRLDVLKELTFTGRSVGAEEGVNLGLLTSLHEDPQAHALSLAQKIASKSPDATRRAKRLFNDSWRTHARHGLELEAVLQKELLGQPNQIEAVMSNVEKRAANYR
ncbi:MAG: crotonase/enoyl-CoA hydratase family protein [Pseudomonadota bacterium]